MNIHTFIQKHAAHIKDGSKCSKRGDKAFCASVFCDGEKLFSYGYHYPLLWAVQKENGERVLVVNATGYSVSTSKHISNCPYDAVRVHGGVSFGTLEEARTQLQKEISEKQAEYDGKKRKDTQVASMLLQDIDTAKRYLAKLAV